MNETLTVMNAVLPVFGIIVLGLLLRRFKWLTEDADQSLLRININVLFPCLVLDAALGNPALSRASNLLLAPLVGFGTVAVGMLIALACGRFFGLPDSRSRRTFAVTVGIYNYGYIPLPLAILLFPGGSTVGVLFLHNVGVELAMWTLGILLLHQPGQIKGKIPLSRFLNAPLVAIIAALVLNWTGANRFMPGYVSNGIHWLGQCAIPMALLLIGAVVADFLPDFTSQKSFRVIAGACLLRLCILPVLFLGLAAVLPATPELRQVMLLEAAMPAAVFPVIMARQYGGDPATALRVVLGTSLVGLITIPLWIRVGARWLQ